MIRKYVSPLTLSMNHTTYDLETAHVFVHWETNTAKLII